MIRAMPRTVQKQLELLTRQIRKACPINFESALTQRQDRGAAAGVATEAAAGAEVELEASAVRTRRHSVANGSVPNPWSMTNTTSLIIGQSIAAAARGILGTTRKRQSPQRASIQIVHVQTLRHRPRDTVVVVAGIEIMRAAEIERRMAMPKTVGVSPTGTGLIEKGTTTGLTAATGTANEREIGKGETARKGAETATRIVTGTETKKERRGTGARADKTRRTAMVRPQMPPRVLENPGRKIATIAAIIGTGPAGETETDRYRTEAAAASRAPRLIPIPWSEKPATASAC